MIHQKPMAVSSQVGFLDQILNLVIKYAPNPNAFRCQHSPSGLKEHIPLLKLEHKHIHTPQSMEVRLRCCFGRPARSPPEVMLRSGPQTNKDFSWELRLNWDSMSSQAPSQMHDVLQTLPAQKAQPRNFSFLLQWSHRVNSCHVLDLARATRVFSCQVPVISIVTN